MLVYIHCFTSRMFLHVNQVTRVFFMSYDVTTVGSRYFKNQNPKCYATCITWGMGLANWGSLLAQGRLFDCLSAQKSHNALKASHINILACCFWKYLKMTEVSGLHFSPDFRPLRTLSFRLFLFCSPFSWDLQWKRIFRRVIARMDTPK